jgi:NAD+ synthase (glutamine-hydrolysing)
MRIALAQIDPIVGAFESNVKKIREAYERACSLQARLLLTPELGI